MKLISVFIHLPISIRQDDKNHFVFITTKQAQLKDRNRLKVQLLSLSLYSMFLFINGLRYLGSPKVKTDDKILVALMSLCIPAVAFASINSWYNNPEDLAALLNMQLVYERTRFGGKLRNEKERTYGNFLKWALRVVGIGGTTAIQVFLLVLILVNPGRPPFLGSVISGI